MHPPPPLYHNPDTWTLLSQGAEARIWHVSHYLTQSTTTTSHQQQPKTAIQHIPAICKERYPKKYRHPSLDARITKGRVKSEVKCLVKCGKGGVKVPKLLGVDEDAGVEESTSSSLTVCLFMEVVEGITVRQFLEQRCKKQSSPPQPMDIDSTKTTSSNKTDTNDNNQHVKPPNNDEEEDEANETEPYQYDQHALTVSSALGTLIAKMHNVNVVHGDLTTSNVMLGNAPPLPDTATNSQAPPAPPPAAATKENNPPKNDNPTAKWTPELTLIDFGLASVISGSNNNKNNNANTNSVEEKAVDLYVLERALISTHPGSQILMQEIIKSYKRVCKSSDAVLHRLFQVRLRGRKRECFG